MHKLDIGSRFHITQEVGSILKTNTTYFKMNFMIQSSLPQRHISVYLHEAWLNILWHRETL